MYTLIVSAKMNDVDPQAWMADVLARLAHSDVSGRSFRQDPVSHSGVSGHLRIVAA
jgi:hypothetical protein